MCSFNSLANCIVLVCLPMIFAGPLDQLSSITTVPSNDDSASTESRYPCARNQTVLPCNCSEACRGPCPSQDDVHHHDHNRNVLVQGMICSCDLGARRSPMRDDYLFTPGIGMHKFHTRSVSWNAARKICNEEGGHLAVINSKAEASVLMGIFNRAGLVKGAVYPDVAYIGMHDIYKEGDWVTILGDTLAKTGFTEWSDKWGGQPDNGGGQQNCGAFLKEGTLDDVQCDAHFPFFCELPLVSFAGAPEMLYFFESGDSWGYFKTRLLRTDSDTANTIATLCGTCGQAGICSCSLIVRSFKCCANYVRFAQVSATSFRETISIDIQWHLFINNTTVAVIDAHYPLRSIFKWCFYLQEIDGLIRTEVIRSTSNSPNSFLRSATFMDHVSAGPGQKRLGEGAKKRLCGRVSFKSKHFAHQHLTNIFNKPTRWVGNYQKHDAAIFVAASLNKSGRYINVPLETARQKRTAGPVNEVSIQENRAERGARMCSFNFLANCIVLICLPMIFAGPLDYDDSESTENSYPGQDDVHHHDYKFNVLMEGMSCSCDLGAPGLSMRDDYLLTPGIGMHKFHTRSVSWNAARKICNEEGGHLAVINSKAEASVLMEIFNRSGLVKDATHPDVAHIGMHDMYEEGNWVTILGDTLAKTGFTEWSDKWGGQPDDANGDHDCGAFLKEGTLDDVHCEWKYPFFCELPLVICS
ncbi:uncharacterized protein LOC143353852 [Halictus rubicundus]|uniref:uncharacterized protein LOC143353852 n=1 Tax=Halictus rubicundus TaxID=77578 RepID=UPI0040372F32